MSVLHVVEHGDPDATGRPLLAVHGVTGHARRWDRLASGPWRDRRVVAVDLRGHGSSTWAPPWSLAQAVDDVLDTLDHLGIPSVDVVGHSYGGAVGLHLAARAPERIGRLVLLDPGFARDAELMAGEADALLARDGWATRAEAVAARSAGWLVVADDSRTAAGDLADRAGAVDPTAPSAVHPDVAAELEHHLVEGPDGRFRFRFSRAAVVTTFGELCRPVPDVADPPPTLLVVADRAAVVTPTVLADLHASLDPHLHVVHLDCGHMVAWDRFDDVAALVDDFLAPVASLA